MTRSGIATASLLLALLAGACSSSPDDAELATIDVTESSTSTSALDRAVAEPADSSTTSTTTTSSSGVAEEDEGHDSSAATTSEPVSTTTSLAPAAPTTAGGTPTTATPGATATSTTAGSPTTQPAASTTSTTTATTTTTAPTTTVPTTTTAASAPDRLSLPAEVGAIEGVATDRSTGRVFVGDLNNGNVWVGSASGEPFELFAAAGSVGRTNALGLATDESRRRLYVVSQREGRIDVVNLDTGAHISSISMPGASSLNDVAVAPDGTAYVSDLGRPVVYRVAPGGSAGELWVDYSGTSAVNTGAVTQHGNGIVADDQAVLLAYMVNGELLRLDRSSGAVSRVTISGSGTAGRDGLTLCGDRLYGAEPSWLTGSDRIRVTDLNADRTSGSSTSPINSPDFSSVSTLAPLTGSMVIANAQFGVTPKTSPFWLSIVDAGC